MYIMPIHIEIICKLQAEVGFKALSSGLNFFNCIEVELIYNVLISAVEPSDLVIYIYIYFPIFFSVMVYHSILNIVPCAVP